MNAAFQFVKRKKNCKAGSLAEEEKSLHASARPVITPASGKKQGLDPWRQQIILRAFNFGLKN